MDVQGEIGAAAAKASPPIAVAVVSISGWGVQEWMFAATLGYIVLQALYLLWKWHREWREPPPDDDANDTHA
jgi:hypothetical protein